MKIILALAFLSLNSLTSCAPKGPTTFETGIFRRDVAQVELNTKKISRNTKECEQTLEETKAVKERVAGPQEQAKE